MSAQPVDTVKRKCKWCGKQYVVPRGSKSEGCPTCAPTIEDAVRETLGRMA